MKIYIYQPRCSYYIGGGEIVPLEQAKFLSKIGNEVCLITTNISGVEKSDLFKRFVTENKNIQIKYIDIDGELLDIYKKRPGMNKNRWDLESFHVGLIARDLIAKIVGKDDLCIVHYNVDLIAIPGGINYVLHLHGYPKELDHLDEIVLYKKINLIAVSNLIKKKWESLLNIDDYKYEIEVIYNGIDIKKFYPKNCDKKYDAGYIGRLIEIKGIQHIIEAIKIIRDQNSIFINFAIAGTGPYDEELKLLVKKFGLENQITFLGYIPDKDLNDFYNSLNFTVLPSYDREGVLTTLLESSACEIPVISTNNTSMAEFIINEQNGLLVDLKNSVKLSNTILELLSDHNKCSRLGRSALKTIMSDWTWDCQIKKLLEYYNKVSKK